MSFMRKSILSITTVVPLLLLIAITVLPKPGYSAQILSGNISPVELEVITMLGKKSKALPEFELTDHHKQILGNERFRGKWNLMFFGYTNCPDVCPNTLSIMNNIMNEMPPEKRDSVKVYFVSVDPERDSLESLSKYMSYFNPDFIAATADPDKLNVLTKALGVSHKIKKKSASDMAYSVNHSGYVVLIDPEVRYSGLFFSEPENVQAIARDMTHLIKNNQHPLKY